MKDDLENGDDLFGVSGYLSSRDLGPGWEREREKRKERRERKEKILQYASRERDIEKDVACGVLEWAEAIDIVDYLRLTCRLAFSNGHVCVYQGGHLVASIFYEGGALLTNPKEKKKLKNLTPHDVTVRCALTGRDFVFPASGEVARVEMQSRPGTPLPSGCPTSTVEYGAATLPKGEGPFIVSTMFADAYRAQHPNCPVRLFVPDSGPTAIREEGRIVAVRNLIRR